MWLVSNFQPHIIRLTIKPFSQISFKLSLVTFVSQNHHSLLGNTDKFVTSEDHTREIVYTPETRITYNQPKAEANNFKE